MVIEVGQNEYKNLVTNNDFLNVISDKVSYEFAREIAHKIELTEDEIKALTDESDLPYIEAENEELINLIDDVNSTLQHLIVPIERGQRINRDKVIKTINEVIRQLTNR